MIIERKRFTKLREALPPAVATSLKKVADRLRKQQDLPGDEDIMTVIPPCMPAWRRPIPQSDLWLQYVLSEDDVSVTLWTIKPTAFWR